MKLKVLLAGLFLIASSTAAFAAGPYLGVAGGVSIVHDGDIDETGLELEYDTGYAFNVSAGYAFEPARVEFEFGYKNADLDKISGPGGSISVSDADLTVMSYMVNGFYDLKIDNKITTYFGAGLGMINGEFEVEGDKEDDTQFGYQLIVGAAYNINKNIALDLSYRFQHAPSDFEIEGTDVEYMSSNIMAGVRFNF